MSNVIPFSRREPCYACEKRKPVTDHCGVAAVPAMGKDGHWTLVAGGMICEQCMGQRESAIMAGEG